MATLTLQPAAAAGKDTYLDSINPTVNYGTATVLKVKVDEAKSTGIQRALLHFDISAIPAGSTISAAVLTLKYASDGAGGEIAYRCCRVTRTAWTELGATWNTYNGAAAWTLPGGDFTLTLEDPENANATDDAVFPGLAAMAQDALDARSGALELLVMLFTESGTQGAFFHSSDAASESNRPSLVITYTAPAAAAVKAVRSGPDMSLRLGL